VSKKKYVRNNNYVRNENIIGLLLRNVQDIQRRDIFPVEHVYPMSKIYYNNKTALTIRNYTVMIELTDL